MKVIYFLQYLSLIYTDDNLTPQYCSKIHYTQRQELILFFCI